jgi:hypothetical protein
LINSVCCVFFLDCFTFWRSAVTVLHPYTTWVTTAVLTTETVLESVDDWPALTKTADDGPSPTAHSVPLVIPAAVDDVEVCVSSGTMKNTPWVTPKRFRRLLKPDPPVQSRESQKKKWKFGFKFRLSQPNHIGWPERVRLNRTRTEPEPYTK